MVFHPDIVIKQKIENRNIIIENQFVKKNIYLYIYIEASSIIKIKGSLY